MAPTFTHPPQYHSMNSVASPPIENASYTSDSITNYEMSRAISSTWHVLEQTPPPSLREVLGAYNSKGDGDRDMLIAMLNAKSAEDQRMASVAALHRTLLEMHQVVPAPSHFQLPLFQMQPSIHTHPARSISRSPPYHEMEPTNLTHDLPKRSSPPRSPREAPPRKRQRTSHPPSPHCISSNQSYPSTKLDRPPSVHSSSRSNSTEYSPRSRASMAIGSLLSSGPNNDLRGTHPTQRRANNYISPSPSMGPISV